MVFDHLVFTDPVEGGHGCEDGKERGELRIERSIVNEQFSKYVTPHDLCRYSQIRISAMSHKKHQRTLPGQLSLVQELFNPQQGISVVEEESSATPIEGSVILLPNTLNSFGYALHVIQNPVLFKRALIWKVIGWLLRGGSAIWAFREVIAVSLS